MIYATLRLRYMATTLYLLFFALRYHITLITPLSYADVYARYMPAASFLAAIVIDAAAALRHIDIADIERDDAMKLSISSPAYGFRQPLLLHYAVITRC